LISARAIGSFGGFPKGLTPEAQARAVKTMFQIMVNTVVEIGKLFHLSPATVFRYLAGKTK
jgi:predicted transcriptional regulator